MKSKKFEEKLGIKKRTLALVLTGLLLLTSFAYTTGCIDDEIDEDKVTIAQVSEPDVLCPIEWPDVYANYVLMQIYDPLIQTAPEGEPNADGRAIAESIEVSDDGLQYTFEIEEGRQFHNGDELTAEDVKFTLNTMMGETDLEDAPESPRSGDFDAVDYIETPDDYTVEVYMEEIDAEFLAKDGVGESAYVLPSDYITEHGWDDYGDELIGSGPYEFIEYLAGESITLEKNEDWHDDVNIENLEFEFYDEESTAVTALRGGDNHYLRTDEVANWHMLREEEDDVIADSFPLNAHYFIAMNQLEDFAFSDEKVRRAFAYAIDAGEVLDGLRTDELGENTRSPFPPENDAHNEDLPMFEQDIEKAQELLEEAGYEDGLETELYTSTGDPATESEIVQDQVEEAGFDLDLVVQEWGGFMDDVQAGNAPLLYSGWTGGASPHFVMEYYRDGSPWEWFGGFYENPEFDETMSEALRTVDYDERMEVFQEAQRILVEEDVGTYIMYTREAPRVWHETLEVPEDSMNPYMGAGPLYRVADWELDE